MALPHKSVLALLVSLLWLTGCSAPESPEPTLPEVAVVTLASETVALTSELPGRVVAAETSEVRPQVSGIIRHRLFEEGAAVQAGDVLYEIEDAPYRAALGSAKAALARAEATLVAAQAQAERYQTLSGVNAISQQNVDNARAAAGQAVADVAAQRAAVEAAEINLDFTRIRAPISGRIGRSLATPGALIQAGQQEALATIQQTDVVHVDIAQSASEVLDLRQAIQGGQLTRGGGGTPVELILPNGSIYSIEGQLQFAEITVNPATGAVTLRAVFPNPEGVLLPGMHVRARLIDGVQNEAILAPQRGISRDGRGRAIALIVNAEDKVERRVATAERAIGDHWLVTEGLDSGDRLIVEGFHRAGPGAKVVATPWIPHAEPGDGPAPTAQPGE